MSGFGNFNKIGGNNPANIIYTDNVENIQQPNVDPQPVNVGGEEPQNEVPGNVGAREISKKLDILLLQAGKLAAKGIDAAALKAEVGEFGLKKSDLKALNKLIDSAAKKFSALDKFTGFELANATVKEVGRDRQITFGWNVKSPAGKAIRDAIDAQAALSEKISQLVNTAQGLSSKAKDVLFTAAMTCDRRACEIETLVMQFAEAIPKLPNAAIIELDQEVQDRLDTRIFDLMGEKSVTMHGNAEAIKHMEEKLAPLAKRLDDFTANPDKRITSEAFSAMRMELSEAKAAFGTLATVGYKVGDGRVIPDKAFMDAAKAVIGQIEERMAGARAKLAQAALGSFIDELFAPPKTLKLMDAKFRPLLKIFEPKAVNIACEKETVRNAALEYAKDPTPAKLAGLKNAIAAYNASPQTRVANAIAHSLLTIAGRYAEDEAAFKAQVKRGKPRLPQNERDAITPELVEEFKAALRSYRQDAEQKKAFVALYNNERTYETQLAHFQDMLKTVARMGDVDFLSSKTLLGAFTGEIAPSTLVEARAHGMNDDDVDPATDQSNVLETRELGKGNANTVTEVKFKNGDTKVFKPEAPGREGMEEATYIAEGYEKSQQLAQLNMATQKTADVLGLGDIMTNTSVGKLNGQYGIFMEKAQGTDIGDFLDDKNIPNDSLSAHGVKLDLLEPDQEGKLAKVQGQLMRKCNRIDWLDAITGQGDRNYGNVMIKVSKKFNVDVKAIDNDSCYPAFRIGITKFVIRGEHLELFKEKLEEVELLYGEANKEAQRKRLESDPGVTKNEDGSYTIDTSKFKAPELNYCLMESVGAHSSYVPNVIDEDLYNHLQALKAGQQREEYLADLRKRMSQEAFEAAVMRLDEAISRADELKARNRVYGEAEWNDREKQKEIFRDPAEKAPYIEREFGTNANENLPCYKDVEYSRTKLTQSVYKRNELNRSAKLDWFLTEFEAQFA